jgi:hypothetical protein
MFLCTVDVLLSSCSVQHASVAPFSEQDTAPIFKVADSLQCDPESVALKKGAVLPSEDVGIFVYCSAQNKKLKEDTLN